MIAHVFPGPSSLFHGRRHPRVPRACTKIPGHQSEGRLSHSAGCIRVCRVVGAWPVRFPCLVLAIETPRQNNTLCVPSSFHLRISKHFADIKRTLPAHSAAGEHDCSRGSSQLSRDRLLLSPLVRQWSDLNHIPWHHELCRTFWWGKASLPKLRLLPLRLKLDLAPGF